MLLSIKLARRGDVNGVAGGADVACADCKFF